MLTRVTDRPLLTREDLPDIPPRFSDVSAVFNPGAVRIEDRTLLLLRVQNRGRETGFLRAWSHDGLHFHVEDRMVGILGMDKARGTVHHVYDPRLTLIDGDLLCCVAMDIDDGCRLGVGRLAPDGDLDLLGVSGDPSRNGVIFPEKIDGRYLRLERPTPTASDGGAGSGDTIRASVSDDLIEWRASGTVFGGRPHYWDELIGAGPPPVKTREGWLLVYHGVATRFAGGPIYQAGVALLDADDPTRVLARGPQNILEPREHHELTGQVPNVVFPTGLIVEPPGDDGVADDRARVRIYYGAADTCVGLAETTIAGLLRSCRE